MKKRILCALICVLMLALQLPFAAIQVSAAPDNNEVANTREGVVRVFGIGENGANWTGTAFGVGEVGKPTDIFVTNRHCILGEDVYGRPAVAKRVYLMIDGNSYNMELTGYVNYAGVLVETTSKLDADTERMIPCDVLYYSEEYDVAILKATRKVEGRVALELAESSKDAVPSDAVYALGYPGIGDEAAELSDWEYTGMYTYGVYGKVDIYTRNLSRSSFIEDMTITTGTVSRLTTLEAENKTKVIQHDAQIHGGNSGGPLVNSNGKVIGINTYSFGDKASLNYAVYIDYAREALEELEIEYNIMPVVETEPMPEPEPTEKETEPAPTQPVVPEKESNLIPILAIAGVVAVAAVVIVVIVMNNQKKTAALQHQAEMARAAAAVPQAVVRKAYVRSMSPQHGGMRVALQNKPILIGRSKTDCTISYADTTPGVSGRHCSIYFDGNNFVVTDMGSSYGTFLQNGQKLTSGTPYPLQPGTSFWLGDKQNVLRVELE